MAPAHLEDSVSLIVPLPFGPKPENFQKGNSAGKTDIKMNNLLQILSQEFAMIDSEPSWVKVDDEPKHPDELLQVKAPTSFRDEPLKVFITEQYVDASGLFGAMYQAPAINPIPSQLDSSRDEMDRSCRWHESAKSVGVVSCDGHVFTKVAGSERIKTNSAGISQRLSSICMIFDDCLRHGGLHEYWYTILDGEVGAADGVGFVFDSKLRRNNIQRTRAIFLNQRGQICFRDHSYVQKLDVQLPPLNVGMTVKFVMDLSSQCASFLVSSRDGIICGSAEVSFGALLGAASYVGSHTHANQSGFFCAIVTKDISVHLE